VRVPDDTVGLLEIAVSNAGAEDEFVNEEVEVRFAPSAAAAAVGTIRARHGDLMASAKTKTVTLFSTSESAAPLALAQLGFLGNVESVGLSSQFLIASVSAPAQLVVYDITNAYAPQKVNVIPNPRGVQHTRLHVRGRTFVSSSVEGLHMGNLFGQGWATLAQSPSDPWVDYDLDDQHIYLLHANRVDALPVHDLFTSALTQPYVHGVATPRRLRASPQRIAIYGDVGRIDVASTAHVGTGENLVRVLGTTLGSIREAVVVGELLATIDTRSGSPLPTLYDIGADGSLRFLASVQAPNAAGLSFHGDLLEWGASYANLRVPLSNMTGFEPARGLARADDTVRVSVSGALAAWSDVSLEVFSETAQSLAGSTRLLGDWLEFRPNGPVFAQGGD
jgi:hypothetical protein